MCEPTTIAAATFALSAASAAATVYSQNAAAGVQNKVNAQNYTNQMQAFNSNIANANLQKSQEAEGLSQKMMENNAAARRDQSKAITAAGEAGLSGLSVGGLLAELGGRAGSANSVARANFERRDSAIEMDRMNAWAGTASNINAMKTPMGADYIGAGLRIATAANEYYNPRTRG